MFIITKEELEHTSVAQLKALYHSIFADLANRVLSALDCPLTMVTLENIRAVLRRKQGLKHPAPRF
ncbi:MAG: hypothetical protein PW788_06780 [Micavibrio sp.]|nr:hypothetical protein [Micavibrio sp.]